MFVQFDINIPITSAHGGETIPLFSFGLTQSFRSIFSF